MPDFCRQNKNKNKNGNKTAIAIQFNISKRQKFAPGKKTEMFKSKLLTKIARSGVMTTYVPFVEKFRILLLHALESESTDKYPHLCCFYNDVSLD